jgi:hypothetical protein
MPAAAGVVTRIAAASPTRPALAVMPVQLPVVAGYAPAPGRRWRVSVWSMLRGDGGSEVLAAAGQLGGSQAGVRATYDVGAGLALAVRTSSPLSGSRGKEVALGVDWRPIRTVPLALTLERRAGLDRGGRDAFAVGVFGGFDAMRVAAGATLDGYAQAGMVGLKRRDGYVDGALRFEHVVATPGRTRIGAGAGIWGGAQPGVSRLDMGPQLVIHAQLGSAGLRIGAEWRQRIAGHAHPGSGPVLSIGADF